MHVRAITPHMHSNMFINDYTIIEDAFGVFYLCNLDKFYSLEEAIKNMPEF